MKDQAKQVVMEFLTAVQQFDTDKLGMLLDPEVVWNQPGDNRFSGTKRSSNEVFQMVGGMMELTQNTFALTDIKVLATNGNSVACLLHFKGGNPVNTLDVDNIDVYTVNDGKISEVTIYSADIEQEDRFWSK